MEEEKGIKQKTVLYINRDGALKNMEDEDIISLVKQGDISAMEMCIRDRYWSSAVSSRMCMLLTYVIILAIQDQLLSLIHISKTVL